MSPADKDTAPPVPVLPEPTAIDTDPPDPALEEPVDSDSEPELEPADEPVATETEPLEPAPALSAEEMPTPPVTPVPLAPLLIFT